MYHSLVNISLAVFSLFNIVTFSVVGWSAISRASTSSTRENSRKLKNKDQIVHRLKEVCNNCCHSVQVELCRVDENLHQQRTLEAGLNL